MRILALSVHDVDPAAVLLEDGRVRFAACEARLTRRRDVRGFPVRALRAALKQVGGGPERVDLVVHAGKPLEQFERGVELLLAGMPRGAGQLQHLLPAWLNQQLGCARELDRALGQRGRRYVHVPWHEALAAAALWTSPFERAALLTLDARQGWTSVQIACGARAVSGLEALELLEELRAPHAIELPALALRALLGWHAAEDDDLLALSLQGDPAGVTALEQRLLLRGEGGALALRAGLLPLADPAWARSSAARELAEDVFGVRALAAGAPPGAEQADAAAAARELCARLAVDLARRACERAQSSDLAVAGRAPFASALWQRVAAESGCARLWVAPRGIDGALGAALFVQRALLRLPLQEGAHLLRAGPPAPSQAKLQAAGVRAEPAAGLDFEPALGHLRHGAAIALACGAAESGLRALGARCVLADPGDGDAWRARAARAGAGQALPRLAVLRELAPRWFELPEAAAGLCEPVLLEVRPERRAQLAGTCRAEVVLVDRELWPELHALLELRARGDGVPLLSLSPLGLPGEPPAAGGDDVALVWLGHEIEALVAPGLQAEKNWQRSWCEARDPHDQTADQALAELLHCPACGGTLDLRAQAARCEACVREFRCKDGIWRLFEPHEPHAGSVTDLVKGFYEEHPFPNYDEHESVGTLMQKSRRGVYARQLFEQLPFDARVLEVGCGTGQLANFLGAGCRTVVGTDLCLNSLRLAEGFRRAQGLSRVRFAQMNLFRPAFAPGSFDVVLCNGVLHHTADPQGGFQGIARLVRPGGWIVIGLYNTWGRLLLDARRLTFRMTGGRLRWIDPHLRSTPMSSAKRDAWFHDQYRHPHESKHSMGEVLSWFSEAGFEFVHALPKTSPWQPYDEDDRLLVREPAAGRIERALAQARMIVSSSREGGFFVMIGRRRN